ncbi:MAG: type II toxin-antitoxin system RelE/ParE family toxin [bacterium]
MARVRWEVDFYKTEAGRRPAEQWLSRQSPGVRAKFAHVARLLEEYGLEVSRPHVAPVRGEIWEMRAVGTDKRMLYVATPGNRLIILHGFAKGGSKVPDRDLKIAERRAAD